MFLKSEIINFDNLSCSSWILTALSNIAGDSKKNNQTRKNVIDLLKRLKVFWFPCRMVCYFAICIITHHVNLKTGGERTNPPSTQYRARSPEQGQREQRFVEDGNVKLSTYSSLESRKSNENREIKIINLMRHPCL